jgi:hypothetical protein
VYGDNALGLSNVFESFKRLKDEREDLYGSSSIEHPSASRNSDTIADDLEMVT